MPVPEQVRIVALRAGNFFVDHMLLVLTRAVTVVLGRSRSMARSALSIDIDRATGPVRCSYTAMAADARASAVAVADGSAALGVPA